MIGKTNYSFNCNYAWHLNAYLIQGYYYLNQKLNFKKNIDKIAIKKILILYFIISSFQNENILEMVKIGINEWLALQILFMSKQLYLKQLL